MVERDRAVIAPCQRLHFYNLVVDSVQGELIYDADQREYVDFLSSASSLNLGGRHIAAMDAIQTQLEKCTQFSAVYSYNKPMIEYAEALVKTFPGKGPIKICFGNCGSDANDAAVKFARGFTKRTKIITFVNSYHGNTYGSSTLSACTAAMHESIGPLLPEVFHFPFYGEDVPDEVCKKECLKDIEEAFKTYLPAKDVAAVIIEPMQGDGGMLPVHKIFIERLYKLCKENGILFIVEEVLHGFYRTGEMFSIQHYPGIEPDGVIMGKSIGGGLTLGAFMAQAYIIDALSPPAHIFTLAGNHLACAAGLASLQYMQTPEFQSILKNNMSILQDRCQKIQSGHPQTVSSVRGLGMSYGIAITKNGMPDNEGAYKIVYRAYERGLVLITLAGNILRIQPALNISEKYLHRGLSILDESIMDYEAGDLLDSVLENRMGLDLAISGV